MEEKRRKKMEITISRIDNDKSYYEGFFFIFLHFTILEGCLMQLKQCNKAMVKFYIKIKKSCSKKNF